MKTEAFRAWLQARRWQGKPLTTVSLRVSKVRQFEKAMPSLGLGVLDLDAAFARDGLEQVTKTLRDLCKAAVETGHAPASLVGDSTIPVQRMNSMAAAVRNYRQFKEGETGPAVIWPALEEMKAAFLERVPAFERFTARDNDYERVERAYKDTMMATVQGAANADLSDEESGRRIYAALTPGEGPPLRWETADAMEKKTPALAPDFFTLIGRLARDQRPAIDAITAAAAGLHALREQGAAVLTIGEIAAIAFTVAGMVRPTESAPVKITKARTTATLLTGDAIFGWSVLEREQVERWLTLLRRIETVMRDGWDWAPRDLVDVQGFAWTALDERWGDDMADEQDKPVLLYDAAGNEYVPWRQGEPPMFVLKPASARTNKATDMQLVDDEIAMARALLVDRLAVRVRKAGDTWQNLLKYPGDVLVRYRAREDIAAALKIAAEGGQPGGERVSPEVTSNPNVARPPATNLILHGPPGTGKTYATAQHAVRLCGEEPPADRAALMARYRALSEAGRIEFVTFHQSMAYEEFVEGLRPVTDAAAADAEGAEAAPTGFRLQPTPGLFRRIARRAETSTGQGAGAFSLGERQVFKMSIGDATDPTEAYLFEEAIEQGRIILGFHDIDWSDPHYASREAIIAACQARDPDGKQVNAQTAAAQMPNIFRNWMKPGDLVIVSKGTTLFRAIGVITGDYHYAPREGGGYAHGRDVQWLWIDRDGVAVEEIYTRRFSMRTTYLLFDNELRVAALERYANSQRGGGGAPEPFVLVIDEINRANISKVFGELITLLEPDKRLGSANALRVRLPYSGDLFGVPANLHIVGTMNTADRSIALIDKALRRRFDFVEMMPDYDLPELTAAVDGVTLATILGAINGRIEYLLDREHQVGHGWLIGCDTREALDAAMRGRVIPLIAEYFFEDWGRAADVLGGRDDNPFLQCTVLTPPPGMAGEETRLRWRIRDTFAPDAYQRLVAG